jgi:hypothetical protein
MRSRFALVFVLLFVSVAQAKIVTQDYFIDAVDPGIKLFVRSKMAEGETRFTDENIVLFVHGATFPSTPDFDLQYKDYSWADWMVGKDYVDLSNAPVKKQVLIRNATHFVLFEKPRFEFFNEIANFLKEQP